jgi:hypothetical protein
VIKFDIDKLTDALGIDEEATKQYFMDGRKVSFIIENRIVKEITGGKRADSEGAGWDIEDADGNKWEVRSVSKFGTYFCPSSMVGSGRKFEEQGFLDKLSNIKGYILTDISQFPNVPVYKVSTDTVLRWYNDNDISNTARVSAKKLHKLLENINEESI